MSNEITLQGRTDDRWFFSDGSSLPVVSGGDGESEGTEGAVEPVEDDGGQGSEQLDYSLANGFLKDVEEAHRPVLEPYIKKWDAGVQRRFRDLHSELAPYKELEADPDDLRQALQIYQILEQDPQQIYNALREQFEDEQGVETDNDSEGEFQGLPPEVSSRLDQQQKILEALSDFVLGQQKTAQEQQEDAELESYLSLLKEEFGDFDEDYVVAKMYRGMDGEAAVKAWQKALQERMNINPPQRPAAPLLSGGGVLPAEQQNVAKIPRKDLKNLVAQMMAQANEG